MANYRKRPLIVQAEQFWPDQIPLPDGVQAVWQTPDGRIWEELWADAVPTYAIKTLEGWYVVSRGDWIITGIKGEKYPIKEDIFRETYESVDEATS